MIRIERPPNFAAIVNVIPHAKKDGVLFAYGEDIFNPSNAVIPKWLIAHEELHCARQTNPEAWWQRYLFDREFRYQEELVAHTAEYRSACRAMKGGSMSKAGLLDRTARRLIAPFYGYRISLHQALQDVLRESRA